MFSHVCEFEAVPFRLSQKAEAHQVFGLYLKQLFAETAFMTIDFRAKGTRGIVENREKSLVPSGNDFLRDRFVTMHPGFD
jgi:hypothetical protein